MDGTKQLREMGRKQTTMTMATVREEGVGKRCVRSAWYDGMICPCDAPDAWGGPTLPFKEDIV